MILTEASMPQETDHKWIMDQVSVSQIKGENCLSRAKYTV